MFLVKSNKLNNVTTLLQHFEMPWLKWLEIQCWPVSYCIEVRFGELPLTHSHSCGIKVMLKNPRCNSHNTYFYNKYSKQAPMLLNSRSKTIGLSHLVVIGQKGFVPFHTLPCTYINAVPVPPPPGVATTTRTYDVPQLAPSAGREFQTQGQREG